MNSFSSTLKRIFNALAYDNVGNLGELQRKLEEDAIAPAATLPDAQSQPAGRSGLRLVGGTASVKLGHAGGMPLCAR